MRDSSKRYLKLASAIGYSLPQLFLESRKLLKTIPRLPAAEGIYGMITGQNEPTSRVLFIGESTIAGVGVEHHRDGFAGAFSQRLSETIQKNVEWFVAARSGYTVGRINKEVIPEIKPIDYDLIVIGIGANDAFKLSTIWKWRRDVKALIAKLTAMHPGIPKVFINTPPMEEFLAFSTGMKDKIGALAYLFAEELGHLIQGDNKIYFNQARLRLADWESDTGIKGAEKYFSDGVHPSQLTYQLWAHHMVDFVLENAILDN